METATHAYDQKTLNVRKNPPDSKRNVSDVYVSAALSNAPVAPDRTKSGR